ncbi:hypothetical protein M419DRAFT_125900 [Trichoderma reesei RUT C-30]|uniref:PH domain-containing protein n=1 Tax=Hypocrea jecorina (strain ATCC 56765 / BCRC 32924 / NRRL 11460 / Rut C-30) TaxID=1344414 RepID=A0A024SKY2_HYPJR|nr:hypothetical protein M419DRAFT_125900 [Trichoderma reesei RUT C-30]
MPEATGTSAAAPKPADRAVPVTLNEAVLDSPTFRATATHFADQVDAVEKWLNGYVTATSKLMGGLLSLEDTINNYLSKTTPFPDNVIDNDYTLLALKRTSEGTRELWTQLLSTQKRMETAVVEPIRSFLTGELRNFKEIRRSLEQTQRTYDTTLARYVSQSKTKEPSALREDAFSVYENRKAYIQAAMDYCQLAPQLRFSLDQLLVKVCCDMWKEMNRARDAATSATRWSRELERVRGWAKEMELSDNVFRREMQNARKNISDVTFESFRPSRELEDYSASTVAFLGSRGPVSVRPNDNGAAITEIQGWLFLRVATGKPVRYNWVRRWYYCRDGVFGWLTPGPQGVLQGDEIGVLLCNVKPAPGEERRFCFELKTKSRSMLLQAETQKELMDWLEVFEVTKKKAFEATMDRGNSPLAGGGIDPAFSICAPSIPEFSAKSIDAQMGSSDDTVPSVERSATLAVPGADGGTSARQSYDPNGTVSRRSISALGRDLAREEGESGREHAARIIQKLDLHRKATFGSSPEPTLTTSSSSGGLTNMVTGNQSSQLVGNSLALTSSGQAKLTGVTLPLLENKPGTLAPPTLARPPTITSLSRTAVLIAGERGHVLEGKRLPTSVVANYWGSNVWSAMHAEPATAPQLGDDDPIGVVVSEGSQTPLGEAAQAKKASDTLPAGYPPELKIQHAQFRLLFPNAPPEERLVLVFRAAWSSSLERGSESELLAGDGRIYVTAENMYFYGQQMGLVTAYSIHLDIITEVTAASGRDCDFIFLHLGKDLNDTGYTRITIKVFLDDLHLLHARLNLLVDNLQAEEPLDTMGIINALVNIDKHEYERPSPSAESWEDASSTTPMDDGTTAVPLLERSTGDLPHLVVPGTTPGQKLPAKLNLPKHEVIYEPDDMTEMAAERHFEISAKACFHVLFGDKSFVFPKLYFEHRAKQIAQGPWSASGSEPMQRDFHFQIDYVDVFGRSQTADIRDSQTIDVFNDHVTYVVTHTRTAWHLPHSQHFKLVTKVVITYVAKSRCKLAFYVRVDWSKSSPVLKSLVDRQALHDAISDAEELAELATDQVHKLGSRSRTSRAIQVYGSVGQQTQTVIFSPAPTDARKKQAIKPRTLTAMLFETVRSLGESMVSSVILWIIAAVKKIFDVVTAHRLLLLLLGLSVFTNLMLSSTESSTWWQERRAANFMRRIGVSPNHMMSKAIYIADLHEASGADNEEPPFPQNSTCFGTFRELLDATSMDSPWQEAGASLSLPSSRATARRLRKTRQRLGMYRHDLLVAMRVVNSVEREVLQSEWENWLENEKSLCDNLDEMLYEDKSKGSDKGKDTADASSSQKAMGSIPPERRRALEAWRDDYCGSCRSDHKSAMQARLSKGGLERWNGAPPVGFHRRVLPPAMAHHEPLRALGPIEWDQVPVDNLKPFMNEAFIDAQTVVESIPSTTTASATGAAAAPAGAVFEQVERALSQHRQPGSSLAVAQQLRKEWKEVKMNAKDNPLNISVYKLAAKDGKGAWFARRSLHHGLSFDDWKMGLEKEFPETLKVQGSPGSGNIRGVGADRHVESREVEGSGRLSVFQLSAQFPGPTAPRDFITLLLTTDFEYKPADQQRPLRQHVIVSKPCLHDECPPRAGIIRGSYESVEMIREVPVEDDQLSSKTSLLSTDVSSDDIPSSSSESRERRPMAVEWIMITRSDPGGSVPRFMVEKGTPPGIVGDAAKFVKWVTALAALNSKSAESLVKSESPSKQVETPTPQNGGSPRALPTHKARPSEDLKKSKAEIEAEKRESVQNMPSSNGIYGIISGVFGAASSVVASGLRTLGSPAESNTSLDDLESRDDSESRAAEEHDTEPEISDISETSSIRTFRSALERSLTEEARTQSVAGSDESKSHGKQLLEKELKKLQEKRRKLDEKAAQMTQRLENKRRGGKEKDEAVVAKLREKHEKEIAKQEAKYRRELQKLEDKRVHEERKAEARRQKAVEREEKMRLTMELEKTRAERDVALKRIEILLTQVGQLQTQNTMLTAKLGKLGGFDRPGSTSSRGSGVESMKS